MKTQCFLLSMFIVLSKTSDVVIRKCCDYNKDLNRSFLCSNETDKLTPDWIPADPFIINSAKSTIKITKDTLLATLKKIYNGKVDIGFPKCDPMWRDSAVAWKDPEIEDQFYLIYDSDKKVRLNLKRDSVYHTNVTLSFSTAFSPESYCIDRGPGDSYFAMLCPCKEITCIRKCCYQNMVFDEEEKQCVHIDSLNLTDSDYDTYRDWRPNFERTEFDFFDDVVEVEYFLMSGKVPPCTTARGIHLEEADNSSSFYFTASGNVKIQSSSGSVIEIPAGEHCGELGWRSGRLSPLLLRCYSARAAESFAADELRAGPYSASLALAGIFLALAALAIATSGELEERMGARPQLAHVASLAVAHFAASLVYLMSVGENKPFCVLVGYLMQFFFLASFFWLNIMCVTMSYTFSALRPSKGGSKRERDRRRFRWYSVYAWGCTAALTVAALAVDFAPGVPDSSPFKPNVGRTQCWFNSTSSLILYFYGPMGILLIANLFLFIYTTWRIVVLSRGSDALRQGDSARHGGSKSSKEKQRYILYAKMFSLMGVTWLTEILSWAVGSPSYIWYITDCINLLRAVFIFIIFCWKPRVWHSVKRKFSHIKCNVIKALGFKRNEEHNIATDHSEPSTDSSRCEKSNSVRLELKTPK